MRKTADAVVIGAGIVGTAIGRELARAGLRAVVVDRNGEAGEGSTRASTAIVRSFCGSRPAVALAHEGRHTWERWPEHTGLERPRAVYRPVGCALLLGAQDAAGPALGALLRRAGVAVETLSGREAHALVPGMRGIRTSVLFEPGAGYVSNPTHACRDLRQSGEAAGVRFLLGEQVVEVRSRPDGRDGQRKAVGVATASGLRIDAPVVVNAAGPHSSQVNLMARAPLALSTVPLGKRLIRGKVEGSAALPAVTDLASGHYVRFDRSGFKLGTLDNRDERDFLADPDACVRIPKSFLGERRRAFLRRHPGLRWHEPRVRGAKYDVTVLDWHPIVDRTDLDGYYVAIGTSGAWFRGAPVLGWLMAQLVAAVAGGRDHDREPLQVTLPYTGQPFDLGFLSRRRQAIRSEIGRSCLG